MRSFIKHITPISFFFLIFFMLALNSTEVSGVSDINVYLPLVTTPRIYWGVSYEASTLDSFHQIFPTRDDNFYLLGPYLPCLRCYEGFGIIKVDAIGNILWQKVYGVNTSEPDIKGRVTADGGLILAGFTHAVGSAGWILKLDSQGNIQWQKAYSDQFLDSFSDVEVLSDGNYLAVGTSSPDGVGMDVWLAKLQPNGNAAWQMRYDMGGGISYYGLNVTELSDGNVLVGGTTYPQGAWLMKLNPVNGTVIWVTRFDQAQDAGLTATFETSNGDIIALGYLGTMDHADIWIMRLNSHGQVLWQKRYGGDGDDLPGGAYLNGDGSLIVTSKTTSFGAIAQDGWLFSINSDGQIEWQKIVRRDVNDSFSDLLPTVNGWLVVGSTQSAVGDDGWLWHVNHSGDVPGCTLLLDTTAVAQTTTIPAQQIMVTGSAFEPNSLNTTIASQAGSAVVSQLCPDNNSSLCSENVSEDSSFSWRK